MLPKPNISQSRLLSEELAEFFPSLYENSSTQCSSESKSIVAQSQKKDFHCPNCEGIFSTVKGLKQHIGKKHDKQNKYSKCPQCSKKFKNKYAVRFHVKQVHDKATRVQCADCGTEYYNKYMLKDHFCVARGSTWSLLK